MRILWDLRTEEDNEAADSSYRDNLLDSIIC
jgi:hypothetical protein